MQHVAVDARDRVAVGGHGVEVAAEHDPAVAPELRARDHVGADGVDRERRRACAAAAPRRLGQLGLVVALRRHRDERGGETEEIGGVVLERRNRCAHVDDAVVAEDVVELGLVVALARFEAAHDQRTGQRELPAGEHPLAARLHHDAPGRHDAARHLVAGLARRSPGCRG